MKPQKNRQPFILPILVLLFAACTTKTPPADAPDVTPVVLKDAVLDEQSIFDNNRLQKSRELSRRELEKLSISRIDSSGLSPAEGKAKYHLLDTLANGKTRAVLIGREYAEENCVWLVLYSPTMKLIDRKLMYEDNSEGSFRVNTVIKGNIISISTMNQFSDTDKETKQEFTLSETHMFTLKK